MSDRKLWIVGVAGFGTVALVVFLGYLWLMGQDRTRMISGQAIPSCSLALDGSALADVVLTEVGDSAELDSRVHEERRQRRVFMLVPGTKVELKRRGSWWDPVL